MSGQSEQPAQEPSDSEAETTETSTSEPHADLEAELATAEAKATENWERYLRAAAEAENIRKRASRDVEHARRYALENFARELLDVTDTLEIGLEAADSADAESLREGSRATLKLLTSKLEQFGITAVDPLGEPFDPEHHEAMSMQPSGDAEPGSVLVVFQKGYLLNGRLLRPARVIVATEPDQTGEKGTKK